MSDTPTSKPTLAVPGLNPRRARPPEIPDFEILYQIGEGAYGEVWLARTALGMLRAIKVVRRDSFKDGRPFDREFEGIRKFEPVSRASESQLDILHVGRGEDYFFYVMELGDDETTGGQINPQQYRPRTLRSDLTRKGRLPFEECIAIGCALASALENLHQNGLVHRDIKPSNVIFINGVPKLADVGLVTSRHEPSSFVGTEGYIAPEGPGGPAADIYSLGKVLYEMATGKDTQDFPELPTKLAEWPDRDGLMELNTVIAKACRPNPRERYSSAGEIRVDFERLKSGKSLARLRSAQRRLVWALRAAAALAVALIGVTAGWFYHARQSRIILGLAREKARLAEENGRLGEFERLQLLQQGVVRDPGKLVIAVSGAVTNPANGHIYYLLDADGPASALETARRLGGTLATVRNAQENQWLLDTFGGWHGIPRCLLIGLYHPDRQSAAKDLEARRKEFKWRSGEPVVFLNWAGTEPNGWEGMAEPYVHIWHPNSGAPGYWNDVGDNLMVAGVGLYGVVEIIPKQK